MALAAKASHGSRAPQGQDRRTMFAQAAAAAALARRTIQGVPEGDSEEDHETKLLASLAEGAGVLKSPSAVASTWDPSIPHEIEVRTNWSTLLEVCPPQRMPDQVDGREICLIESLFTPQECSVLLAESERHGFGTTAYTKSYRGNLRLQTTDFSLSDAVWQRIRSMVPATVSCSGCEWDAVGLNECWRLAKYFPGDRFMQHCDASFSRNANEQSMFTVNIYMNEGFEGGKTRFYLAGEKEPDFSVVPKTGLCLLFRQNPGQAYMHDGELLTSGLKYLFRSDVMYRRRH